MEIGSDQEDHMVVDLMEKENLIEIGNHMAIDPPMEQRRLMEINQHMGRASHTEREKFIELASPQLELALPALAGNLIAIGQVDQATLAAQQLDQVLRLEGQDQTGKIET